ncbi:MAG: dihydroorotate dehydrogenase electron transfer subunit [Clostridiaceae bacterium]
MEYSYEEHIIYENIKINEDIYKIIIKGEFKGKPGQFYMLRAWDDEPILSRPISINYINKDEISFLYKVCGKGTQILKKLKKGDSILLTGPLGNGFKIEEYTGKIAVVSGGIGIAPMEYLVKSIKNQFIDLYVGFKEESYTLDNYKDYVDNTYIATESGKEGHKGYILDILNPKEYDLVLCCGPEILMKKVVEKCKISNTKVFVSMEKKMACGVGACLVCTCKTKDGNKRTCKDGPVFNGEDLEY